MQSRRRRVGPLQYAFETTGTEPDRRLGFFVFPVRRTKMASVLPAPTHQGTRLMTTCRRFGVSTIGAIVLSAAATLPVRAQVAAPATASTTESGPPVLRADPSELGLKL